MTSIHYCVTKLLRKKYTLHLKLESQTEEHSGVIMRRRWVSVVSFKSRVRGSISKVLFEGSDLAKPLGKSSPGIEKPNPRAVMILDYWQNRESQSANEAMDEDLKFLVKMDIS